MSNIAITILKALSGVPSEIQVIPFGRTETSKGVFILDAESAKSVIDNFDAQKNDMVIDYEHQTLAGTEAPAAGWIKRLTDKGSDGIWAVVEWTARATEYLKGREYRYLSPVFLKKTKDNKVVRLINAALTNQPAIDGMVPIVNKNVIPACPESTTNPKEVMQMNKLLALLGLPETATEDEAVAKVQAMLDEINKSSSAVAAKEVLDAMGLKEGATASEVVGTVLAMKQSHAQTGDVAKELMELKSKFARKEADEAVAQAMKDGKITPAQKDWAIQYATRDLDGFRAFAAKASVVVSTGELAGGPTPAGAGSMDETQAMVNKQCGVSDETFKKYAPKEA